MDHGGSLIGGGAIGGVRYGWLAPASVLAETTASLFATLPGWKSSTLGMTEMSALPANARAYVDFLSEKIGVEIGLVSTGPERSQTIIVQDSNVGRWLAR